ncbi:MAG: tRNA (adenosine(37)-N6)-threonylcarbamoyltransferase complex ATPase subunit type 1 TsaE [Candidatus Eisenbacteria bacterium]|nr:tRNA (adenosine(37)-N6)-threonylcarbamoyltransferase complex ATPase subunit type 1 TsaE [Candidatus Eisenbacteria bacterium]
MTILVWRTRSEEETVSLGRALALALVPPVWVGLTGPLGAGKTRLVQGIADGLHYPGRVRSPTFVLENRYAASVPIVHQDLYRLSDVDEEILAGWEENVDAIVLVEWAERADERPERAVSIEITPIESTTPTAETLQPEDASDSSMRPSPAGPAVTPDVAAVDDVDQQGEREIRVRFAPGLLRLDQTTRAAATEVSA